MTFPQDNLTIKRLPSRGAMEHKAAADVAARIHSLLKQQAQVNMIFAAAPSLNEFLAALTSDTSIDWRQTIWIWLQIALTMDPVLQAETRQATSGHLGKDYRRGELWTRQFRTVSSQLLLVWYPYGRSRIERSDQILLYNPSPASGLNSETSGKHDHQSYGTFDIRP